MVEASSKILIVGAAGFLGTALSRRCSRMGLSVFGLDLVASIDLEIFQDFRQTSHPENDIAALLVDCRPCYLVNFAGNADVRRSIQHPRDDFARSADLFSAILDLVRRYSPETKVLLASSAAVYGQPLAQPILETQALQPISPYGYHKWMCELLAREYTEIYGLKTATMRIFSAYGVGLRKQILWDLCRKCQEDGSIELGGDGTESRDFIHVEDVANAALGILFRGEFAATSYNVATGTETTIAALAGQLIQNFGIAVDRLSFTGVTRSDDPKNWCADVSRLKALDFAPEIELFRGLAEYAEWFKKLH